MSDTIKDLDLIQEAIDYFKQDTTVGSAWCFDPVGRKNVAKAIESLRQQLTKEQRISELRRKALSKTKRQRDKAEEELSTVKQERDEANARVKELEPVVYAVARKFPGESRIQTAIRYINNAERGDDMPAQENREDK